MKKLRAFTLVELLVVILIIGVLATLVILSLSSSVKKAKDARAIDSIKKVQTAFTQLASEAPNGTLESTIPTAAGGGETPLTINTLKSATGDKFFTSVPKDAQDRAINIKVSGDLYVIYGQSTDSTKCWRLTSTTSNLAKSKLVAADNCSPDPL